ncbi:MAG: hypothetical protein SPI70_03365, partial [Oscillospiraceae bacterium]|nr:hypothetical protein [Oscillospiraceae bacterium]
MRKHTQQLLSSILTIALLLSLMPTIALAAGPTGSGTESDPYVYEVATADDLSNAVAAINADTSGTGHYVINIQTNIDCGGTLSFTNNTTTIIGNRHTVDFGSVKNNISVRGGSSNHPVLILGKNDDATNTLTIRSNGSYYASGDHFIVVGNPGSGFDYGTLKMHSGVTISGAVTSNAFGGGVLVGAGGTLEMNGGLITECGVDGGSVCHGGGVAVISGGVFTMNDGTISNCFANSPYDPGNQWQVPSSSGGGVFVGNGSTFIMKGGAIENNFAYWDGGGVMVMTSTGSYGNHGGFGYLDSKFVMTGGTIRKNTANYVGGGLAVMGTYINAYGLAAPTPAAGSPTDPGVYISGGTFEKNSASNGGGIFLNWIRPSIPVQIYNAVISENTAGEGAGIDVLSKWTQADIKDCTIRGNRADGHGGGIALTENSSGSGTTLKNTAITGNTSGELGAGVYYDGNSKLTISGNNQIQNNKYIASGVENLNNLNIFDADHPVYIGGALTGSSIGLSDPALWADGLTDEDTAAAAVRKLTSGYKDHNPDTAPHEVFTSDHNTWYVDCGENTLHTETSYGLASTSTSMRGAVSPAYAVKGKTYTGTNGTKLYYDTGNKCFTTNTSGAQVNLLLSGGSYYLTYNENSSYYVLKNFDWTSNQLAKKPLQKMSSLGIPVDSTMAEYPYIRCSNPSGSSTRLVYLLTENTTTTGYDDSSEVRLTRTKYILQYRDGREPDGVAACYDPANPVSLPTEVKHFSQEDVNLYPGVTMEGTYFLAWFSHMPTLGNAINANYPVYEKTAADTYTEFTGRPAAGKTYYQFIPCETTPDTNLGDITYYAQWVKVKIDIAVNIQVDVDVSFDENLGGNVVMIDDSQKQELAKNFKPGDIVSNNCEITLTATVANP